MYVSKAKQLSDLVTFKRYNIIAFSCRFNYSNSELKGLRVEI